MARNALCTEIFQVFNCRVATSLSVRRSRNFSSTLVEAAVLIIYRTSIDCLKNISPHPLSVTFSLRCTKHPNLPNCIGHNSLSRTAP